MVFARVASIPFIRELTRPLDHPCLWANIPSVISLCFRCQTVAALLVASHGILGVPGGSGQENWSRNFPLQWLDGICRLVPAHPCRAGKDPSGLGGVARTQIFIAMIWHSGLGGKLKENQPEAPFSAGKESALGSRRLGPPPSRPSNSKLLIIHKGFSKRS